MTVTPTCGTPSICSVPSVTCVAWQGVCCGWPVAEMGTEEVLLLEQAVQVTRTSHDVEHQGTALENLIRAHWQSGAHRKAVVTLGELVALVGEGAALRRCPPADARRVGPVADRIDRRTGARAPSD